ncbi:MAG: chemotaxis protein CheB [Polyangiaceae bacterium]
MIRAAGEAKPRVLVVDDSPIFSDLLASLIADDPGLELAGVASDGARAVALTESLRPDLVVMDVLMPVMDGLTAIEVIMASRPTPILVMTADPRGRTGELSLEALARGALDLVVKPTSFPLSKPEARRLTARMRALAEVAVVTHLRGRRHRWKGEAKAADPSRCEPPARPPTEPGPSAGRLSRPPRPPLLDRALPVAAVVASIGGPSLLARVLADLPPTLAGAVVIVQHLQDGFGDALMAWLGRNTSLPVMLASEGHRLAAGEVVLAPPGRDLVCGPGGRLSLVSGSDAFCPSGDALLRSFAAHRPRGTLGLVLSGMGRDGAEGLAALRRAGGRAAVQEPSTAVVGSMPRSALSEEPRAEVWAPEAMAAGILRALGGGA